MKKLLQLLALSPSPYIAEVNVKLLNLLYTNLSRSFLVVLGIASLVTYALWGSVDQLQLSVWYAVMLFITSLRFYNAVAYLKHKDSHSYHYWYTRFTIYTLLTALAWSLLPLLFFCAGNATINFFIAFVLLGMIAGASTTLAADLRLMHGYLYILFFPLLYSFLQHSDEIYIAASLMTVLFIPIVSISARTLHRTLLDTHQTKELYDQAKIMLHKNENRLSLMFKQAPVGIFYYDNNLTIVDCNTKLEEIMQASREQLIGLNLNNIPDPRPLESMNAALTRKEPTVYEGPYESKVAGLNLYVKIQMTPLIDADGTTKGGLCMMEDKSKEHEALEASEFLSLHDPLTALPNRKLLKERMDQIRIEQKRQHSFSVLLFLDIDHFKQINDSLGHNIGDKILMQTSKRLSGRLRESDTLSRLGGDEFVILLPHLSTDHDQAIHNAHEVTQKIHAAMDEPFSIDKHQVFSSVSIGVSLFCADITDSNEILRRADMAMYQSKAEGRKRTSFYNKEMDNEIQHYIEMKKNLHDAIQKQEFTLYYQPILTISSNQVTGAEVLLRWNHNGQTVPTDEFIKVAEESSLINDIGCWVIKETCQQVERWINEGTFTLDYVTINISARQLLEKGFSEYLLSMITQHSLDHRLLKLEITETALITNFDKAKEVIEKLNAKGLDFVIDDFGTGYSSLSYLKMLPFTALKIDKSFVQDILINQQDEKLIRAIINTAEQFGYRIIAEGIEEEAQRTLLKEINPKLYYQGYLAAKPLSAEDFQNYLQ